MILIMHLLRHIQHNAHEFVKRAIEYTSLNKINIILILF